MIPYDQLCRALERARQRPTNPALGADFVPLTGPSVSGYESEFEDSSTTVDPRGSASGYVLESSHADFHEVDTGQIEGYEEARARFHGEVDDDEGASGDSAQSPSRMGDSRTLDSQLRRTGRRR